MSDTQKTTVAPGPRGLAGYCWATQPSGGHCTRPPGHDGDEHVDYYSGRTSLTATSGAKWSEPGSRRRDGEWAGGPTSG
ncbi:MAG: hypothetical protein HOZ81_10830 [Streptomyces sp.]|nr:hypothetical protein [Streptomyces sp.]NUS24255.1 hypothetical protein [Streptomyces sp.]